MIISNTSHEKLSIVEIEQEEQRKASNFPFNKVTNTESHSDKAVKSTPTKTCTNTTKSTRRYKYYNDFCNCSSK